MFGREWKMTDDKKKKYCSCINVGWGSLFWSTTGHPIQPALCLIATRQNISPFLKPHNFWIEDFELHKVRRSPDFEALNLWNVRPGLTKDMNKKVVTVMNRCVYVLGLKSPLQEQQGHFFWEVPTKHFIFFSMKSSELLNNRWSTQLQALN